MQGHIFAAAKTVPGTILGRIDYAPQTPTSLTCEEAVDENHNMGPSPAPGPRPSPSPSPAPSAVSSSKLGVAAIIAAGAAFLA